MCLLFDALDCARKPQGHEVLIKKGHGKLLLFVVEFC